MLTIMGIKSKSYIIAIIAVLFAACQSGGEKAVPAPVLVKNEVTYTAQEGLTTRQRFSRSLEHLEKGREGQAKAELEAIIKAVPGNTRAQRLLEQITTESNDYFPKEYFSIKLSSGASLSTLSKEYLGSALKFYALAKYNNITNPSRVNIGQTIKIPSTQLAKKVKANKEQADISIAALPEAEVRLPETTNSERPEIDDTATAVTEQGLALLKTETLMLEPEIVGAAPLSAKELVSDIVVLNSNNDYETAMQKVEALKSFGEFDQETRTLALTTIIGHGNQIADNDKLLASNRFAEAGQLNLIDGAEMAALLNFKRAVELNPDNQQAQDDRLVLQQDVADKYHREASSAFRRQELDVAIAKWDQVLEIYPEHTNAQVYRAQAIDLKARLKKLNN